MLARLATALACVVSMELHAAIPSEQSEIVHAQRSYLAQLISRSDDIIGLEAIVADGTDEVFYSRFGHAMLRFVKADGNFATDIVLSLMADADLDHLDLAKATFGGYPVFPLLRPLSEYWEDYVQTENRPLSRHIIVSTPAQRKKLIGALANWINNPKLAGTYTFINNNCVGALARLLEEADFPKTFALNPKVPVHFGKWLNRSLVSPFPALRVDSPRALIADVASALKIEIDNIYSGQGWPDDAARTLHGRFTDLQIKQFLMQAPQMPSPIRSELASLHHFGNGGATLEEAMSFRTLPAHLYELCDSSDCAQKVLRSIKGYWTAGEWQDSSREDAFSLWLATGRDDSNASDIASTPLPRTLPDHPDTVKYYQLLLE